MAEEPPDPVGRGGVAVAFALDESVEFGFGVDFVESEGHGGGGGEVEGGDRCRDKWERSRSEVKCANMRLDDRGVG